MRAVVAVFTPDEEKRTQRLRKAQILAELVMREVQRSKHALMAILLTGRRVIVEVEGSQKCKYVRGLRSAMVIGTYDAKTDLKRITEDLEATITEYEEGRPTRFVGTPAERA